MSKRVFIMGTDGFPRGTAGANYDQYLGLALLEQGWEVIVLGTGVNLETHYTNGKYIYNGIEYYNYQPKKFKNYGLDIVFFMKMVKKYSIHKSDYFIFESIGWTGLIYILHQFDSMHMVYVQYEDLQSYQFNHWYINPHYWDYRFRTIIENRFVHKAFPISEILENKEKKYNCRTLRLPIMADPYE